jgi:hypothetical protein
MPSAGLKDVPIAETSRFGSLGGNYSFVRSSPLISEAGLPVDFSTAIFMAIDQNQGK